MAERSAAKPKPVISPEHGEHNPLCVIRRMGRKMAMMSRTQDLLLMEGFVRDASFRWPVPRHMADDDDDPNRSSSARKSASAAGLSPMPALSCLAECADHELAAEQVSTTATAEEEYRQPTPGQSRWEGQHMRITSIP
jgi:hypothetical protein